MARPGPTADDDELDGLVPNSSETWPQPTWRELFAEAELESSQLLWRNLLAQLVLFLALWLPQWWFAPNLIVDSEDADNLLTALPGAAVGFFALIVASLLVVAQVAATSYRSVGVAVLARDQRIWSYLIVIAATGILALLLAAFTPNGRDPPDAVAAALSALTIYFALLFLFSGRLLRNRLHQYTDPLAFSWLARGAAERQLHRRDPDAFIARLGDLGQLVTYAIQERDNRKLYAALGTLRGVFDAYLRQPPANGGTEEVPQENRVGQQLAWDLLIAAQEGLALHLGVDLIRAIPNTLFSLASAAVEVGAEDDACILIVRFAEVSACSRQLATEGIWVEREPGNRPLGTPLDGLAVLASQAHEYSSATATALELWAVNVVILYREGSPQDDEMIEKIVLDSAAEFRGITADEWGSTITNMTRRGWSYRWAERWHTDALTLMRRLVEWPSQTFDLSLLAEVLVQTFRPQAVAGPEVSERGCSD